MVAHDKTLITMLLNSHSHPSAIGKFSMYHKTLFYYVGGVEKLLRLYSPNQNVVFSEYSLELFIISGTSSIANLPDLIFSTKSANPALSGSLPNMDL